jgi:hypothetical protein
MNQIYFQKLNECITKQTDSKGRMPYELRRGRKALTYTLMNLEAFIYSAYLAKNYGFKINEEKIQKALDFFLLYFENETKWREVSGIKTALNRPKSLEVWQWILVLPRRWWKESNYFVSTEWWNIDAGRAYLLFYPQLLKGEMLE